MSESEIRTIIEKLDRISEQVTELRVTQVYVKAQVDKVERGQEVLSRDGCEIGRIHTTALAEIKAASGEGGAGKMAHMIGWPTVALALIYLIAKAHGLDIPLIP